MEENKALNFDKVFTTKFASDDSNKYFGVNDIESHTIDMVGTAKSNGKRNVEIRITKTILNFESLYKDLVSRIGGKPLWTHAQISICANKEYDYEFRNTFNFDSDEELKNGLKELEAWLKENNWKFKGDAWDNSVPEFFDVFYYFFDKEINDES